MDSNSLYPYWFIFQYQFPTKMSKPAVLNVHVVEGKGKVLLLILDMPFMGNNGSSDSFVSIKIGNYEKKSKVVMKNLTPIWNDHLQIEIPFMNNTIEFSVYEWDSKKTCLIS